MKKEGKIYSSDYLQRAHNSSSCHKKEILANEICGCFYCGQTYSSREIEEWIDEENGYTAICPKCGVDAVLSAKFPITDKVFLGEMHMFWF